MIRLCLVVTVLLSFVIVAEEPPSLRYPNSRTSKKWIESHGVRYAVDDGLTWQGLTIYLGSSELIAVEPDKEKALWLENVGAFWNFITFKEVEMQPGKKEWAVELRARKDDDPEQKLVQYHDLKTGKKLDVPSARPSGERLPKLRALQIYSSVAKPFFALVSTQENYDKAWQRLTGPSDPIGREDLIQPERPNAGDGLARAKQKQLAVDFEKEVVLIFCAGDGANSSGISEIESYEDEARILLRTDTSGFQTMNRIVFTRDCTLFVLPRRINKSYVLEHDVQNYIGGPSVWKEKFRVRQIGDAARELDNMPPPPQANALPPDFKREIKKFKTEEKEGANRFRFSSDKYEYDYYLDAAGKEVRHGPYRKFEGRGADEKTNYKGNYVDGKRHGLWTFYERDWGEWDGKHPWYTETYDNDVRHGPIQVFFNDGRLKETGQFERGVAHGVWTDFHDNGIKYRELRYDRGMLHGAMTIWDTHGNKIEERTYVTGQLAGLCTRWYADGKVALKGDFIAGDKTVFATDATGSELYEFLPGLRHGDWIRYAPDGKEIWRGNFNQGTGVYALFSDDGKKLREANLVNGVIDGEYRTWSNDGWLESVDLIRPRAECVRTTYYPDGQKKSETNWRAGYMNGIARYWDKTGNLESECEWREGKPWNGDHLQPDYGSITRYSDGVASKAPPRYTKAAQEKQNYQAKRKLQRERRGIGNRILHEEAPPKNETHHQADENVRKLEASLKSVDRDERERAAQALIRMGSVAVPVLTQFADSSDLNFAKSARDILSKTNGQPGKAESGVTLSAAPAGPRPMPGECVPLWITLTNTSDADIYIFQHLWSLWVSEKHSNEGRGMIYSGGGKSDYQPLDFLKLSPGQSYSTLMDAEPYEGSRLSTQLHAVLQINVPDDAKKAVPGKVFDPKDKLTSAEFDISYREEVLDPAHMDKVFDLLDHKKHDAVETALKNVGAEAAPALRLGLRLGDASSRWSVFKTICKNPLPELEEDVAAFWNRYGNNWMNGNPGDMISKFSRALPEERRLKFLDRIVAGQPQDFRTIQGIIYHLSGKEKTPDEKAHNLRYCMALYERGFREHSILNYMAWQRLKHKDPALHDFPLAVKLAREAVLDKPDYHDGLWTLAVALSETNEPDEALKHAEKSLSIKHDSELLEFINGLRKKLGRPELKPEPQKKAADF